MPIFEPIRSEWRHGEICRGLFLEINGGLRMSCGEGSMELAEKDLLQMYRWMVLDRKFEERTFELLKLGKLVGFHHPNVGQEAVDVGTCYRLRKDDTIMPTHRGKGKY